LLKSCALLLQSLLAAARDSGDKYKADDDQDLVKEDEGIKDAQSQIIFKAGQSKRIWNELYKVDITE
jgi:nuclear GTP-binding protein